MEEKQQYVWVGFLKSRDMSMIRDIKQSFKENSMVVKLIYINIAVFVIVRLSDMLALTGTVSNGFVLEWLAVPVTFSEVLFKPWTILTYMFCHYDLLHILFNMFFLHWFGRLFVMLIGEKKILSTYLIGGLGGFLLCIIVGLIGNLGGFMLGASASVLALLSSAAVIAPNYRVNIVFVGNIRLKYYALIMVFIDFISILGFSNVGGHIAHLGGLFVGVLLAMKWKNAGVPKRDWIMDNIGKLGKNCMKVHKGGRVKSDYEFNSERVERSKNIDRILEKIKASGYDSLTQEERKALFDESKRV